MSKLHPGYSRPDFAAHTGGHAGLLGDSFLRLVPVLVRAPGSHSGRTRGALTTLGARPVVTVAVAGLATFTLPDHRDVGWGSLLHRVSHTFFLYSGRLSVWKP